MTYTRLFLLVASALAATTACSSSRGRTGTDAGPRDATVTDSAADSTASDATIDGSDTCSSGMLDGDETDVDCGGGCPPCDVDEGCATFSDCASMVCAGGRCGAGSCDDGLKNAMETGVDCGGGCRGCAVGSPCNVAEDCSSFSCSAGACDPTGCDDRVLNGMETDVDCGGPVCPGCDGGEDCLESRDCASTICLADRMLCTLSVCTDGILNGDEAGVDCGGPMCDGCPAGSMCRTGLDCAEGGCDAGICVTCADGMQNALETDLDCGGPDCDPCADGLMCALGRDCVTEACDTNVCVSCTDGATNAEETDTDCGGPVCDACLGGAMCSVATDCTSGVCDAGVCAGPSCVDGVLNQDESDVDCGGDICDPCADTRTCVDADDCESRICDSATLTCTAPGCTDGVLNAGETDVDCGGATACPRCADFRLCGAAGDCTAALCTDGRCGDGALGFAGFTTWSQAATSQSDAQQDALMDAACAAAYPGSVAASGVELASGAIVALPASNTTGDWLTVTCPGCEGLAHSGCVDGHARNCVDPGDPWPTTVWDSHDFCHTSTRSVVCVM